jgi:oxygen-dependent protoporphyrinogen oxidase
MHQVVVIGGGISGLAVAYRLKREHGVEVTVLEAGARPGGKVQTEVSGGFTCEEATNGWLDREPVMRELAGDLGIDDQVQPCESAAETRFIYRRGRLREIPLHPLRFMRSSALPLGSRLRLALEPLVPKGPGDRDESLAEFAARRLGKGARDLLIGPMASGVYAGDPEKMSVRSCFGKVWDLEQRHGGLIKGMVALKKAARAEGRDGSAIQAGPSGRLTSFRGGMGELIRALARDLGSEIELARKVVALRRLDEGGFEVIVEGAEARRAAAVVSASPAWAAARYLEALDDDAARAMAAIPYPALDVVCLGFREEQVPLELDGFGFLVPRGQGKTILGSLWTSSIFLGRAPDGHLLTRTMVGGMLEPQVAGWSERQVVDTARREIEEILQIPAGEAPVFSRIFRHARAIPQYHVGHSEIVARLEAAERRNPGLFVGGNAIGGIGVIDCVRASAPVASRVVAHLEGRPLSPGSP